MKIYIELPDNIFDIDQADLASQLNLRRIVETKLEEAICDHYVKNLELPKIEISEAEVKDRIITLMARKALNQQ